MLGLSRWTAGPKGHLKSDIQFYDKDRTKQGLANIFSQRTELKNGNCVCMGGTMDGLPHFVMFQNQNNKFLSPLLSLN